MITLEEKSWKEFEAIKQELDSGDPTRQFYAYHKMRQRGFGLTLLLKKQKEETDES